MFKYMLKSKLLPFLLLGIALLCSTANVGYAKILELITNTALGKSGLTFEMLAIVVVIYLLSSALIVFMFYFYKKWYRIRIMKWVRDDLYKAIINRDIPTFEALDRNFYLSKFTNDLHMLEEDYYGNIMYATGLCLNLVLAIIMTITMRWQITIAILLLSLPSLGLPFLGRRTLSNLRTPVLEEMEKITTTVDDTLSGFRLIKFNMVTNKFIYKEQAETKNLRLLSTKEALMQQIISATSDLFGNLMYLGSWVVGTYFVLQKQITLGQLVSLSQLVVFITVPLGEITPVLTEYFGGRKVGENIKKLIDYKPKNYQPKPLEKRIKYNDLSSKIANNLILKKINVDIRFSQKTILVGESGGGKSSMINVLLGTLPISSGGFRVLDKENDYLTEKDFKFIGFLPQTSVMINDSLLENVRLYDEKVSLFRVKKVLREMSLEKLIPKLNDNMNNVVNELSGGEKRRLDLVRITLKPKKYYIFDEPTTGLDPKTATEIEKTIFNLSSGFLLITHHFNLDIFKSANQIIVINRGTIVATGTFSNKKVKSELMKLKLV